ncbi:MAG: RagB/SusD family nutrient uptake outer membrane protein [Rikenellaceae bacterium]|jgi:hypothetical protein|nr:RagB/SusD family nutrient uptake outer membrane protein [Rikenellaceae bacterium]
MKSIRKITLIGAIAGTLFLGMSCQDVLEEKPRTNFTPSFFEDEAGVKGGITVLYSHLRLIFGDPYWYNITETGTDEYTWAQSADGNFKNADLSGLDELSSASANSGVLWGDAFRYINTASGILEYGEKLGLDASLLAEARFFRAFDYFYLVQTFGGVPLDLGAGELKLNTSAVRTSVRNTVPEVYTKAIFPDLLTAINDLPTEPRLTGTVTKTVARFYLAKAYLTYAWWLENPNAIPTWPETPRTDPDGKTAANYYQMAYDMAMTAINNPGPYGLQPTFYDVNNGPNDRNSEILLYADHTEKSELYNDGSLTYSGDANGSDNYAGWMVTWNYPNMNIGVDAGWSGKFTPLIRIAEQWGGRPWTRMAPTLNVFSKTFAEKSNDSRYDGTFVTVYRANWPVGGGDRAVGYGANGMEVKPGDAVLTFLSEEPSTAIDYSKNGENIVGGGVLPGRADFVIAPSNVSRLRYPGLWKLGPYRTDNGTGPGQPNASSTRPFNIAKFSEFYLIAAEAAVKGANGAMSARDLVNVLRARAGKWSYSNADAKAKVADYSAEMVAATPATIDINYILDERGREFFGEGYRWFDLVRTQKWNEYADTYQIAGVNVGDLKAETFQRQIEKYHYLRPIPRGQLDGLDMTDEEKAAYQNPGYKN